MKERIWRVKEIYALELFSLLAAALLLSGCVAAPPESQPEPTVAIYPPAGTTTPSKALLPNEFPSAAAHATATPTWMPIAASPTPAQASTPTTSIPLASAATPDAGEYEKQVNAFLEWAKQREISIVGVNESTDHFYYNHSKPSDFLDASRVPNLLEVAKGLYKLPDELLKAMAGKSFYASYLRGRGYTVLGSWPEQGVLGGMKRGAILEQPLNEQQAVHEFSHILDYHGIRGSYDDSQNYWKHLDAERAEVFNASFAYNASLREPPEGHVDAYSTANDAENFAQHFAAFVLDAGNFRKRAANETLLARKYGFMKKLFGKEYR